MQTIIGIPVYNEGKNIASVIVKLKKLGYDIIVCNDGSTDLTAEIAEKMGVIVINHPKNLGYGAGIRSIFLKAKELDVDILVTFDGDGQHRTQDISKIIEPILKGEADIVIGSRFLNDDDSTVPNYRKIGIKTITGLINVVTKKKITDSQSGFRAYNKKTIQQITPSDYGMGVSTEILIKADKKLLKITEVPIMILYEGETSTHNPVSHGFSVILSTIKFISIEHPLKFYGIPGIIFLILGLFFIVWTLQEFTISRKIITNIALIAAGSSIIGIIFMMTATILYSVVSLIRERN